jgi:hypothetical protein
MAREQRWSFTGADGRRHIRPQRGGVFACLLRVHRDGQARGVIDRLLRRPPLLLRRV